MLLEAVLATSILRAAVPTCRRGFLIYTRSLDCIINVLSLIMSMKEDNEIR